MGTESWERGLPSTWRAVRTPPSFGAYNMAVDAMLLASARARDYGVWRTYAWLHPTVSFGRNERVVGRFAPETLERAGFHAVRRPTGGRALLHAHEVTYSVTLPLADSAPWTVAYDAINRVLVDALRSLGASAELATASSTPAVRPIGPLCFDQPSRGEIVVEGAKLVGSAVWRERGAYLQHGSILLSDTQSRLQEGMCAPHAGTPAAASLATCLPSVPSWDQVAAALEQALRRMTVARHGDVVPNQAIDLDVGQLALQEKHFRDPEWLWRR